jgi:hypothetical protein
MTKRLGESLDRRPGWRDAIVIKLHLFTCDACERYLGQIKFLKDAMHAHGEPDSVARDDDTARRLSAESKDRLRCVLRGTAR